MFAKDERLFLLFLLHAVPTQAKVLLKHITRRQYSALREVAINLLRGSLNIPEKQISILRKYKTFYRQLARGEKTRLLQKPIITLLQSAEQTIIAL